MYSLGEFNTFGFYFQMASRKNKQKNIKKLITEFIYLKNNECKIVFIQQFKTLQIQLLKKHMAIAKYYGT